MQLHGRSIGAQQPILCGKCPKYTTNTVLTNTEKTKNKGQSPPSAPQRQGNASTRQKINRKKVAEEINQAKRCQGSTELGLTPSLYSMKKDVSCTQYDELGQVQWSDIP